MFVRTKSKYLVFFSRSWYFLNLFFFFFLHSQCLSCRSISSCSRDFFNFIHCNYFLQWGLCVCIVYATEQKKCVYVCVLAVIRHSVLQCVCVCMCPLIISTTLLLLDFFVPIGSVIFFFNVIFLQLVFKYLKIKTFKSTSFLCGHHEHCFSLF